MLALVAMLLLFGKDPHGGTDEIVDLRNFKMLSLMVSRWVIDDKSWGIPFSSLHARASTVCCSSSADLPSSTATRLGCNCAIR